MSQELDWSLVEPTLYLSEVAFMKNSGYDTLSKE